MSGLKPEVLLEKVKQSIKTCEKQKVNSPEYYKQEVKEHHELLILIKDELENNLAKAGKGEKP